MDAPLHSVAIIPARGGSKRLPGKNIKPLLGKPMIAYAIDAARQAKRIDRVIVTTDDPAIAAAAKDAGAEVPFMRPAELATDTATTLDVLQHAVTALEAADSKTINVIMLIQPTAPLVLASDIDDAVADLERLKVDCCVSMSPITDRPEWLYTVDGSRATPFGSNHNITSRTQDLPEYYRINGAIYAARRHVVMEMKKIINEDSLAAVVMPRERSVDIDELSDFLIAEALLRNQQL